MSQSEFDTFTSAMWGHDFRGVGGDQKVEKYDDWVKTVQGRETVIKTEIGILSELSQLDDIQSGFGAALESYFTVCPSTDASGVCNGLGTCNFETHQCQCMHGSDLGDDGSCHGGALCPNNCNGRGDCRGSPGSVGQCQCHMIDDHFGYGGESCEANCGSKTISPPFSLNTQSPPDLDCYCRNNAIEGRKDAGNDMVAKSYTTRGIGPFGCVYGCNGDHKACNPHVPGYDTVVDLHCQYGELASCENNNNASSGGVGLPASRAFPDALMV